MNIIKEYFKKPYEERLVINTSLSIAVSTLIVIGKAIIGIFVDHSFMVVSLYGVFLVLAKLECLFGIKSNKRPFERYNFIVFLELLLAGILYVAYMSVMIACDIPLKEHTLTSAVCTANLAIAELSIAIYGLIRVRKKGNFYRDIKIINFSSALTAILTGQATLLAFTRKITNVYSLIGYTGIAFGIITILLAFIILLIPKLEKRKEL